MATVYFHVGTPKTGTSAIQDFCSQNRNVLETKGICYPDFGYRFDGIGQNRNGHFLVKKFWNHKERALDKEKQLRQEGTKKLLSCAAKYNKVILSDEQFWNNEDWMTDRFQEYSKLLKEQGVDLKVIVYLRRQDALIQSYWAQQVKETMTMSFSEYISSGKYKYFRLDYGKRLKEIADGIGSENVIVRIYEKDQYQGEEHTIISDFLWIFGEKITEDFSVRKGLVNPSLSGIYLEIKRILNASPAFKTKKNFVVPLLTEIQMEEEAKNGKEKVSYFSAQERKDFLARFEEEDNQVAKTYLGRKDGGLFLETGTGQESEEKTIYSQEELIALCGKVIALQEKKRKEQEKNSQRITVAAKGVLKGFLRK